MKIIRSHIISKLLCLVMALHVFNCSVDMPDAQPDYIAENLSINDMESVVEILLEEVLNIKDAIAEHDEPDQDLPLEVKLSKSFYFQNLYTCEVLLIEMDGKIIPPSYNEIFFKEYIADITPPPPKV